MFANNGKINVNPVYVKNSRTNGIRILKYIYIHLLGKSVGKSRLCTSVNAMGKAQDTMVSERSRRSRQYKRIYENNNLKTRSELALYCIALIHMRIPVFSVCP